MPGHNGLYVGRNRLMNPAGYVSPYLLEILNSSVGFSSQVATGTLTALTGQTVSCSRTASAYCLGNDGLLHLLGANTVRVEPTGLLVEGAATNTNFPSNNFSGWSFVIGVAQSGGISSPDAGTNGKRLTCSAGAQQFAVVNTNGIGALGSWTLTVYAKAGSMSFLALANGTSNARNVARFDLGGGTVLGADAGTGTITPVTGLSGWYRCQLTFSVTSGDSNCWIQFATSSGNLQTAGNPVPTWTAAGGEFIDLWQADMVNLPFASSPISTTTASATRDADIVTVANPLASLGQPVNVWRAGFFANPMTTWANVTAASGTVAILLAGGTNAQTNTWRFGTGIEVAPDGAFQVDDSTVTALTLDLPGAQTGSTPATWQGLDTSGTLTGTPGGGSVTGTGTGVVNPQPGTIYVGQAGGITGFGMWGHFTDIVVNNS